MSYWAVILGRRGFWRGGFLLVQLFSVCDGGHTSEDVLSDEPGTTRGLQEV